MSDEKTYGYMGDSQDQIDKCLNCWREECINCLSKSTRLQEELPPEPGEEVEPIPLDDQILELYRLGMNDCEIARVFDKSATHIRNVRKKYDLPPNASGGRPTVLNGDFDEETFFRLYKRGYSDLAISRTLDVPKNRIGNFRRKHNLAPNYKGNMRVKK